MNSKQVRISLDAMSGDLSCAGVVKPAIKAIDQYDDLALVLVGDQEQIQAEINQVINQSKFKYQLTNEQKSRLTILHAPQTVNMEDSPVDAIRNKKDSSMRYAIDLVKEGKADACVSSGNTGALMGMAKFVLKTIEGVSRPAICASIPNLKSSVYVLDLGANIDCTAEQLYQFAIMASILAKINKKIKSPKVGLLNVGSEEIKGSAIIKQCNQLLKDSSLNYCGYVEGDGIYLNDFDVIVCDGFIGNAILKCSEGLAKMFASELKRNYHQNLYSKIIGYLSLPIFKNFINHYNPKKYNGASFLGLKGIVIKSHGNADTTAFLSAINQAYYQAKHNIINQLEKSFKLENSNGKTE